MSKGGAAERPRPQPAQSPPRSFRERFLHTLPDYTGPYTVGYLEIELPARDPRPFSHIKRNHEHALKLDTVLFSVYYPCEVGPDNGRSLSRVNWLPKPRIPTTRGYAKFLNIPRFPVTAYIACTSMFTKIPAFRNARLATTWPLGTEIPASQEVLTDDKVDDTDSRAREAPKFPVVIFSHGLGGSRTAYSAVCGELASFGFVVVAVEHRDGSGARTYVNKGGEQDLDSQNLDRPSDESSSTLKGPNERTAEETRHQKERSYYKVDYIFPLDNAQDTSPHNARGVDTELRGAQIEMRLAEIEEAYYVLTLINSGQADKILVKNLREKGKVGASSKGLDGVDWDEWKDRMYLNNVTMMGHSFGGATTVQACRLDDRFEWISSGILLDAWGPATPEGSGKRLRKPILSIGSEAFMHWKENYDRVEKICHEGRDGGAMCWMTTIRGSTHLSQTDFAVLYPNWMSLLMKNIVNPRRAIYLTIGSALEFLKIVLPPQQTRFKTAWADEHLLRKSQSESRISLDHRPDDKWIAARLKIENELILRLKSLFSWSWSWRRKVAEDSVPKDALGQPLPSLLNFGLGNELWVHQSPNLDTVKGHMTKNRWSPERMKSYVG